MTTLYDFSVSAINGEPFALSRLKKQVVLIVNTASACGYTPQLAELQQLQQRYGDQGLVVLGFPCNQFGAQDPGTNAAIADFCQLNFGVTFPLMAKIEVKGPGAHPLYRWLVQQAPGLLGIEFIKWNFTKFLVSRGGAVLARYAPLTSPKRIATDIERALAGL